MTNSYNFLKKPQHNAGVIIGSVTEYRNEPNFMNWNLNRVDMNVDFYPVSKKVNYALNEGKELIN